MTDLTGIRSSSVTVNGLRMHVTDAGAGTPVLLLHGFPESSREWAPVMTALSDRARLVAPDLRGAGETDAPNAGYDSETVQRDLIALLDELGLARVDLVAHDWGAIVGFDLCLSHPDRVRNYVAVAVPAPYLRMNRALALGLMKALPHLWFQWVVAMPGLGPALLSRGRQRLAHYILDAFKTRPLPAADVAAYVEALRDPARARAASKLYRGIILSGFMKAVNGAYRGRVLETRTLVLFGADDRLLPKDALHVGRDDAPHTTLEFVPGGGHYLVDENPAEVARRIGDFLRL
ncbi:alpha/beta fold hydrolase [Microbacterium sp. CFH 31415]|uniref:alpha/beta fold hydrolase n=1 Tax=Microbacterium sp. CFH 31415 TaxID=2921732 RepID=UPI001F13BD99|nr:alpha/beta fold hydrolase [Microbacterium sp. CFH 31415]MCH6230127.1 alpha/beta fold hydrolase [Microbacterium sp. CFH 31415]